MTDWGSLRAQAEDAFQSFLNEEMGTPEMQELIQELEQNKERKETSGVKHRSVKDASFTFTGNIPHQRRCSSRIANKKPEYTADDLSDIETDSGNLRRKSYLEESVYFEDLDEVVFRPKIKRKHSARRAEVPFVAAEDVTEEYIAKIAWRVANKEYSELGTSCHQCRQKTKDSKTFCRSGRCIGVRGQFCGVCLRNRYGEDAGEALRDSNWECPPCRNLCNCSICRTRQGKMPTGILAPVAQNHGYKSVADFLKHLQAGKHGSVEQVSKKSERKFEVTGNLLGFDDSGNAVMAQKEE